MRNEIDDLESKPEDAWAAMWIYNFVLGLAFLIVVGWQLGRIATALESLN